jgi:hypothetical protein
MTRARMSREIACGIVCALALSVMVPLGIVMMLGLAAIDALARLLGARRR